MHLTSFAFTTGKWIPACFIRDGETGSDNILWSRSDEGYRTLVL